MVGRTVIAIAHRLSTLRSMDRILMFENGQIVADGSHENLLQASELYKRLWNMQILI
jgi:ABC-type multidrug transport system fused ATPase/permease subunit